MGLLKEDGDGLLLESGGALLLDAPTRSFTLDPVIDDGLVGLPRMHRHFTLDPVVEDGPVGEPRWVLPSSPVPVEPPVGPPSQDILLPSAVLQLVEPSGAHVAWLSGATSIAWRRELDGPGSVSCTLQRTDPVLDELRWDRHIRVWLDGELVHAGLIEPRDDTTLAQEEEAGQTVTIGGRGVLALLAQGTIDPIRLALQPVQDSIRFNFGHPDFDDAGWVAPKVLRYLDEAYAAGFTVPGPYWGMPLDEWWDLEARVIGPWEATITNAPVGKWYVRKRFHVAEDTTLEVHLASDGPATVFLDGQLLKTTGMPEQGMTDIHEVTVDVSAGWHVIAAEVTNRIWKFTSANPTGFLLTAFDGRPWDGNVVVRTDSSWRMLAYPTVTPGWTAGKIIRWLLNRWAARGGPNIQTTFTDKLDTAGKPWPIIPDETFQCGRSLLDAVMQLAEQHLDVSMAPSGRSLSAWRHTTRGKRRSLSLRNLDVVTDDGDVVVDDGDTVVEVTSHPCLKRLQHRTEPPLASRVLARWEGGWISRTVARPWYREMHVQLPATLTEEQAARTADQLLDAFSVERVETSAEIHPTHVSQRPFTGFSEGDWIWLPDRDGVPQEMRVLTVAGRVDQDGVVGFEIEAGDRVRHEQERLAAWMARMQPGAIGGRTEVAQPSRVERDPSRRKEPTTDAIPFDHPGPLATGATSNVLRPSGDWLFVRWIADLVTPGSTNTGVSILVNGVAVASFVIPAGERSVEHTTGIWATRVDRVQVQITSAGAGAAGLTVTPIYRVG